MSRRKAPEPSCWEIIQSIEKAQSSAGGGKMMAEMMAAPEPDNMERIARGRTLKEAYIATGGTDPDSPHDMITDILHMIHADGGDTGAAIRMAVSNFEAERDGEE